MRHRSGSILATLLLVAALASACSSNRRGGDDSQGLPDPVVHARLAGAIELRSPVHHYSAPVPGVVAPTARAEQAFTLALLQHLSAGSRNSSVSPAGLGIALAMLQNGAAGATQAEMLAALRAGGLSAAQLDEGWLRLTRDWSAATSNGSLTLSSANALWVQHGFAIRKQFMADLSGYFDTGLWQTDFSRGAAATDAIDRWTAQQTRGRITKLFDRLDPRTVLVLADAVYFKAAWASAFDAHRTRPGPFTRADGSTVTTPFLSDEATTRPVAVTPGWSAVQLPYRGGRFAALAVIPTTQSLHSYLGSLTVAGLDAVVAALHPQAVDLALPKFTTTSELDLKPVLQSLGMRQAFSDAADLSGLSTRPTKVDQVIQRVYLAVAEKGTEAAAATGVSVVPSSARAGGTAVRFDHPFLFLIRDTVTGAILFASQVTDPTAG